MSAKVGLTLALDGEKEFKKGLKNVNLELKLMDNQMKMVSAQYDENANSIQALTAKQEILTKKLEQQNKKIEMNKNQLETWQEVSRKAGLKVAELKDELEEATQDMKKMGSSSDATEEELKKQQETVKRLTRELKAAEAAYDKSEGKIAQYRVDVSRAEVELTKLDAELKRNEKYLDEAEKSSDGLAKSIDQYGNKVQDAKKETKVFGDVLKASLASEAIIHGVEKIAQGIGRIASSTVQTGAGFEASMSQVAATMGMTAEEIEQGSAAYRTLEEAAEESGKATKYTASQAAEALNYLALAGYDAQKAAETLPSVLNLASAGGLELGYASDLVTDSMAALGLETNQLNNYIDQLARTSQKSNTSVAQLGEGSLIVAGTASMTGQAIETLNAELGVLANRGIKGAEGGTHLRNILLRLVQPTEDGAAVLRKLKVEVADSEGEIRDLNAIMEDLNHSLSSMSESDKTNLIGTIFNKTDISAVNALLKGTGDEFNSLKNELLNCDGAAANMAETMEANLTGKVTVLKSALEGLGITAYKRMEGTFKDSVDSATGAVGRLQSSMDNGKLGEAMDDFSEALGDAAESAIDFAEDALPVVIAGLTWVLENSNIVAAGIAGIAAASFEMKKVAPAVQVVTEAWKAYKTSNEGATVSQWLLNGAMKANLAGIIITAIVGLTAAVATYSITTDDAAKRAQKFREEHEKMLEEQNNQIQALSEENQSLSIQADTIDRLTEELTALNDKEKLTVQDKSRIKQLVEQLNQIMPELNLTINEQTGYLDKSTAAAEKYIKASKEMLMLNAAQEDMQENATLQYEAQKKLTDATLELEEVENALADAQIRYNEACEAGKDNATGGITLKEYGDLQGEINELTAKKEVLNNTIETEEKNIQELDTQYQQIEASVEQYSKAMEKNSAALAEAESVQINYKDQVYTVSSDVAESIGQVETAYAEAKAEALDSIDSQVGLFEELSAKSELSISQMVENLRSQTEAFTNYADNLKLATEIMKEDTTGNFTEIVNSISELGMAGAGYLDELITAYQNNSEQFNQVLSEWGAAENAKEMLASTMGDMKTDYTNNMEGLVIVQKQKGKTLEDDSKTYGPGMAKAYTDAGSNMLTETEKSMKGMTDAAHRGGQDISAEMKTGAQESVSKVEEAWKIEGSESKVFKDLGSTAALSMANGIKENQLAAVNAAIMMAETAYQGAKNQLNLNNPSKTFESLADMPVEDYKNRFMVQMQDAISGFDEIVHPEENSMAFVRGESNAEIRHLTRLLEEYLPECAKAKTLFPINQISREMASPIDKSLSIQAERKKRYN